MSPIVQHPDVRRLLLTMRAQTDAARLICYRLAHQLDIAHREADPALRQRGAHKAALLTPVAKSYATDMAVDTAAQGIMVFGGMGFVEETGIAQTLRDATITRIYEGTNGIQAIDLVTRKLPLADGAVVRDEIAALREIIASLAGADDPAFASMARILGEAVNALARATDFLRTALASQPDVALAGATPFQRLFALALGGCLLADRALAAHTLRQNGDSHPAHAGRIATARFFAENLAVASSGLEQAVISGSTALLEPHNDLEG
jgi:butyryl-CoA dehydrogenase